MQRNSIQTLPFVILLLVPLTSASQYTVDYQVVVQTADASPDGNGVFSNEIGPPVLNDSGEVAFLAKLLATADSDSIDDLGLYRASASNVATLVRGGDPSAAGNRIDLSLLALSSPLIQPIFSAALRSQFALDAGGRVVFVSSDDNNQDAIYRTTGQQLEVIMQSGQSTSFGSNVNVAQVVTTFLANDVGQLAFLALSDNDLFQVLNTNNNSPALLRSDQMLDDGRSLAAFRNSALNNNGQMLLRLNTSNDEFGYYVADSIGTTKVLHVGEPAPDGLGSFAANLLTTPNMNDVGEAIFQVFVDDAVQDYVGLFFFDGTSITELLRSGDPTFGGDFVNAVSTPRINNNGSIAYRMRTTDDSASRLVLRRNGGEVLVISEGTQLGAPINLSVDLLRGVVINDQDQLLFRARLRDGGTAVEALLLFDPDNGLALVARHGQSFLGDTIASITAAVPFSGIEPNANWKNAENSFNNAGQVAFTYLLQSGAAGVALADVVFPRDEQLFVDSFEAQDPVPSSH